MEGFVYRLLPPRPGFAADMSADERAALMRHADYWAGLAQQGRVVAYGAVSDPEGAYGIAIVLAESQAEVEAIRDADPAITAPHGLTAKIAPMLRLVTPGGTYEADATGASAQIDP